MVETYKLLKGAWPNAPLLEEVWANYQNLKEIDFDADIPTFNEWLKCFVPDMVKPAQKEINSGDFARHKKASNNFVPYILRAIQPYATAIFDT